MSESGAQTGTASESSSRRCADPVVAGVTRGNITFLSARHVSKVSLQQPQREEAYIIFNILQPILFMSLQRSPLPRAGE